LEFLTEVIYKLIGITVTPIVKTESFYGNESTDPKTKEAIEQPWSRRAFLKQEYWIN